MGISEGIAPSLGQLLEMRWPRVCLVMEYLKITTMNNKTYFCILKILHEMEQCPYMFLQQSYSSNAEGL